MGNLLRYIWHKARRTDVLEKTSDALPAISQYRAPVSRRYYLIALTVLFMAIVMSIKVGAAPVSWRDLGMFLTGDGKSTTAQILIYLRIPRTLLTLCVGAILALSGAVMQGLFRNALADPSLIGVSAGASAGASLSIVFGASALAASHSYAPVLGEWLSLSTMAFAAFVGAMVAVAIVYRLASNAAGTSVATMLLAGVAISALAASMSGFLEYVADDQMLRRISLWRMGGLDGANYIRVILALMVALPLVFFLPKYSTALNVLLLGESEARFLGVDVQRLKRRLIFLVALAVGVSVALAGTIAFVGLMVPHAVRLCAGPDHRHLLPLSGLFGSALLLLADTFARLLMAPSELPVGLITAMMGAPCFIVLLLGGQRKQSSWGVS